MRTLITLLLVLAGCQHLSAQTLDGPRFFWDIPHLHLAAPDIANVNQVAGLGLGTTFNVANHYATGRAGFGSRFLVNPTDEDIPGSFYLTPYGIIEAGGGLYRTNTNQCATANRSAYTAMVVVNGRYLHDSRLAEGDFQFGVGIELGYFYIRNMLSNNEVVLRSVWYGETESLEITLGFRHFLNVREMGRY